jgi:hypothetical protein
MQRIFGLFVFAMLAAALVPSCRDEDPVTPPPDGDTDSDTDTDTDSDTDTDTDSEPDAGPDGGEPFDCDEFECPSDGVLYVDADATGGETGSSWADAASDLQLGLAIGECCAPAQLWVAEGTYVPGPAQDDTFQLINGVALYGGFDGTETALDQRDWSAHLTALSGAQGGTFHVVTGASGATLDGFTITGGGVAVGEDELPGPEDRYYGAGMRNVGCDATLVVSSCRFTGNTLTYGMGAGMYNEDSSPTVTGCAFESNTLGICSDVDLNCGYGGGMANFGSSPTVSGCTFDDNEASRGGGMYSGVLGAPAVTDCAFTGNRAFWGAGMAVGSSAIALAGCSFEGNEALELTGEFGSGGGFAASGSSVDIEGCAFASNFAKEGGGMLLEDTGATVADTVFSENSAEYSASGLEIFGGDETVVLTSCAFAGNTLLAPDGDGWGAAVNVDSEDGATSFANCSFHGNDAGMGDGGAIYTSSAIEIANSILFGDSPGEIATAEGVVNDVTYSLVSGGHAGIGNIDGDPLFFDAEAGDLHLQPGSPCIDAANSSVAPEFDLEGNPRFGDADMGVYEFIFEK